MKIRFFTRKDFTGWRKIIWLPVSLLQGRFVHCELEVDGMIFNADVRKGVEKRAPGPFTPSAVIEVDHDTESYITWSNNLLGSKYSWSAFFKLLLPRWGSDPKGFICSELVAQMIVFCASDKRYRIPFSCIPPYRWTPNAVYECLSNLKIWCKE